MPDTAITLDFGEARYRFWLPMARIVEIETNRGGKSIVTMFQEFSEGMVYTKNSDDPEFYGIGLAHIADVAEIIRCAAIGGRERYDGEEAKPVSPMDAKRLVDLYVDGRPMTETVPVAWAILNAAIMGVKLKKKAEPEPESPGPTVKAT